MDNIAHSLVGAAIGRAIGDSRLPAPALLGAIAANAPDFNEFLPGMPPRSNFNHRGITHSLLGAAIQAAIFVIVTGIVMFPFWRRENRPVPWKTIVGLYGAALASHLLMDWLGSYGLRPFLPWSNQRYYGDWVAIVDPFFWLLPLIALAWGSERHWIPLAGVVVVGGPMTYAVFRAGANGVVAPWVLVIYLLLSIVAAIGWLGYWFGPVARRRTAVLVLLVLGLYAGAQGVAVQFEKAAVRRAATTRFGPAAQAAALTRVGRPFTWSPIYIGADTVVGDGWRLPRHLDSPVVQRALRDTREGRAMAQFARLLVAEVDSSGNAMMVYLRDARYARTGRDGWGVMPVSLDRGR